MINNFKHFTIQRLWPIPLFATIGFCLVISLSACGRVAREEAPDVSHLTVDLEVRRFERDLFQLDTTRFDSAFTALRRAYPEFSDVFIQGVLGLPQDSLEIRRFMRGFITFPPLRQLYDTVQIVYGDLSELVTDLEQALRYFQYYFPERPQPAGWTTYISEYSIGAFVYGNNELATGLDFFLGADYPYWKYNPNNPNFSNYLVRTYNRQHLIAKTLRPLVQDLIGPPPGNRLLDFMVHNGKELYLLDKLMPGTPDTVLMEVTAGQWDWLVDNEQQMWAYFLAEDLLYSTQMRDIRKLIEPSPNSPGMPPEAPGGTANWMGWQIVRAYMERFPETGPADLLEFRDAQQILTDSRYKPRRN